jgi:hypothetical protein
VAFFCWSKGVFQQAVKLSVSAALRRELRRKENASLPRTVRVVCAYGTSPFLPPSEYGGMRQNSILLWFRRAIVRAPLLLGVVLLVVSCGSLGAVDLSPACPPGAGRGTWDPGSPKGDEAMPISTEARDMLENPDFGATPQATSDLERRVVVRPLVGTGLTPDERTISAYATAASPIVACSYSVGLR